MAFNTITSANATFLLTVAQVYPGGVNVIGFDVDNAFAAQEIDVAETQVGVDGYGVAGFRPAEVPMDVRVLAASPAIVVMENWLMSEYQLNDKLPASLIITLPSIGRKYACQYGVLMRASTMSEVRRVLAGRPFRLNWLPQGPGNPAISAAPM